MQLNQTGLRSLPILLFLVVSTGSNADEADAFNFFVGSNVVYDNNVFRLSPDINTQAYLGTGRRSDTTYTEFVGGSFDKLIGRQRVKLSGTLNTARFDYFSQLNNNGGNARAELDYTFTDDLTGTVGKEHTRALAGYRDQSAPVRNIQNNDGDFLTVDMRLQPILHLEGSIRHAAVSYGALTSKAVDNTIDAYSLAFRFTPASGNTLALRNTWTKGDYPNQQFIAGSTVDNSFDQIDTALEANYQATGASRLSAVLGRTERTHPNVPERNFSGFTGNAAWDWTPSGKTSLTARIRREIGAQDDQFSSYVLTDAVSLVAGWAVTAKTSFRLNAERASRDFLGDPQSAISGIPTRHDIQDMYGLTATYMPNRTLVLSLSANREKRSSNYPYVPYTDTNYMLNAQFSF